MIYHQDPLHHIGETAIFYTWIYDTHVCDIQRIADLAIVMSATVELRMNVRFDEYDCAGDYVMCPTTGAVHWLEEL